MADGIKLGDANAGKTFVGRLRVRSGDASDGTTHQQQPDEELDPRAFETVGGDPGRSWVTPMGAISSDHQAFLPPPEPHLPVLTLKAPQCNGSRQSPIRSLVSSTYGDHSCATTRPGVCETMLN